jgi:hypothetical protein
MDPTDPELSYFFPYDGKSKNRTVRAMSLACHSYVRMMYAKLNLSRDVSNLLQRTTQMELRRMGTASVVQSVRMKMS